MSPSHRRGAVRAVLERAVRDRVTPGAVIEVGRSDGRSWIDAVGALTYDPGAPPTTPATMFDLASLTKVIATTSIAMRLVERHALDLGTRLEAYLPEWRGSDRERVTLVDLLAHAAGLAATLPLYETCSGRAEFERAICASALAYSPRSRSVYSDLGFILLGFVLEDVGRATLDALFAGVVADIAGAEELRFRPGPGAEPGMAPTQFDAWRGRLLQGEVDDRNGAALGGVAGHTGLFGSAASVGAFARAVLSARLGRGTAPARPETVERFLARDPVPGSSRALGWDRMLPTSSCGARMSPEAFGHTGFTGTSLWIDPVADVYVVLLTNRVYPAAGSGEGIAALRRAVHDTVMAG